jgi:hypothetical protein
VYDLKNELIGDLVKVDQSDLEHGFDTEMIEGKYYTNPNLNFNYFCESVGNSSAKMWLIESYQGEGLLQAIASVPLNNTAQFVEVTDRTELARLRIIHENFKRISKKDG